MLKPVLFTCFFILGVSLPAVYSQLATFDKAVDFGTAPSGQDLLYTMDIGCSSLDNNCLGAKLMDTLPNNLLFNSAQPILVTSNIDQMNYPIAPTYDPMTHIVTWDFTTLPEGGMPAGFSATVMLSAHIPAGSVENGALISNKAGLQTTNATSPTGQATTTVTASPHWNLEKSVTSGNIYHDRPVTYHVKFCSETTVGNLNLTNVVITDHLPSGAMFISATNGGTESGGVVTWNVGNLAVDAACWEADIVVKYPANDPNNDTGLSTPIPKDNQANVTATPVGGGSFTDEAHAMNPLLPPYFELGGYKYSANNSQLTEGKTNYYGIAHSNNSTLAVNNYTIVDQLPPQVDMKALEVGGYYGYSTPISYTISVELNNSGTYTLWQSLMTDGSYHNFQTSTIAGFNPPSDYISGFKIEFGTVPDGFGGAIYPTVTDANNGGNDNLGNPMPPYGTSFTNHSTLTATNPISNAPLTPVNGAADMCITKPNIARLDPQKSGAETNVMDPAGDPTAGNPYFQGAKITFTIRVENDGPDDLDPDYQTSSQSFANLVNPIASDLLPSEVTFIPSSIVLKNNNTALTLADLSFENIDNFNGTGLKLLRWTTNGTLAPDEGFDICFDATVNMNVPMGTYVTNYYCMSAAQNFICDETSCGATVTQDLTNFFGQASSPSTPIAGITEMCCKNWSFTVADSTAVPTPSKNVLSSGPYAPTGTDVVEAGLATDTMSFQIKITNDIMANSTLPNPIGMDLLPIQLDFVAGSLELVSNTTGLTLSASGPNPVFEVIPNFKSTGRTLLRWKYTGEFPINSGVEWKIKTFIKPGQGGSVTNSFAATTNDRFTDCISGTTTDTYDMDNDGNDTELFCSVDATPQYIQSLASFNADKFVKGACDANFKHYPLVGTTLPGDTLLWKLRVSNPGNVVLTQGEIVDIFPWIGDVGVKLNSTMRGTGWVPTLDRAITVPSGMTIYYSQSTNPCRDELNPVLPGNGCVNDWTTVAPSNLADVKAIKILLNDPLQPGETHDIFIHMKAPTPPFTTTGPKACNSLGRDAAEISPQEPNKVCIILKYFDLALRKTTTASNVTPGSDVPFNIEVVNQGALKGYDIKVTDYLPTGFTLSPNDANGWTVNGSVLEKTIVGPLDTSATATLPLLLRLSPTYHQTTIINDAEISHAAAYSGGPNAMDIDSQADAIQNNDLGGVAGSATDDLITDNNVIDEDDHDPALVTVAICNLTSLQASASACNDNGTPTIATDDTYTISINPIGDNLASTYSISGSVTATGVAYGSPFTSNPLLISAGTSNITVTDSGDGLCSLSVMVSPPSSCSNQTPCSLTSLGTETTCYNNGTPTDPSDDTFTFTLNPTGNGLGSTYSVSGGATASNLSYGSASSAFGPFPISGGNLSLTITDDQNSGCALMGTVTPPAACSVTLPCPPNVCLPVKTEKSAGH